MHEGVHYGGEGHYARHSLATVHAFSIMQPPLCALPNVKALGHISTAPIASIDYQGIA